MEKNFFKEKKYKKHHLAALYVPNKNAWYVYLDKQYIHGKKFASEKDAFKYLRGVINVSGKSCNNGFRV